MEEALNGRWYIQNRVIEPITPTAWVVNGFADLTGPAFLPGPGERSLSSSLRPTVKIASERRW
jgi:hypothetical protein